MSALDSNNIDGTADVGADVVFSEERLRLAAQVLDRGDDSVEIGGADQGGSDALPEVGEETNNNAAQGSAELGDGAESEQAEKSVSEDEADADDKGNEKPEASGKPPSKYEKAKKDAERYDRNWKKLQERQAELARAQAELAQRERALAQQAGVPTAGAEASAGEGRRAEDFEAAAADWERAGKFDLAELARKEAVRLRSQPSAVPQQVPPVAQAPVADAASGPSSPAFIAEWNAHLRELERSEDFAALSDRDSELYKATADVLRSDARFSRFPDGIRIAAQIARLRVDAEAVPKLREQLQAQQGELAKLRAATSPSRGVPNSRGVQRSFDDLSAAEAEAELRRLAAELDAA